MAATPQLVIQVEGLPSLRDSGGGTDSGSTRRDLAGGCHVVQRGFPSHGGESTRAFLVVGPGACRNVKLTLNWGRMLCVLLFQGEECSTRASTHATLHPKTAAPSASLPKNCVDRVVVLGYRCESSFQRAGKLHT